MISVNIIRIIRSMSKTVATFIDVLKFALEARPSVLSAAIFGEPEDEQKSSAEMTSEEQQLVRKHIIHLC